jgi:hypothetical protein
MIGGRDTTFRILRQKEPEEVSVPAKREAGSGKREAGSGKREAQ